MLDQFTHLFRFQAIVEEGSLRKASERLNLTQPALSRSLALLESAFGRPLLDRHARGVRPTPYGARVLATARRMSRQWDIAQGELRQDDAGQRVSLRLGLGPTCRSGVMARVLDDMRRKHSNLLIEIVPLREETVLADLDEGRLDAVLGGNRVDPREHPHLMRHRLTDVTLQITAREGHPAFARLLSDDPSPEQCLLEYPWITFTEMAIYADTGDYSISDRLGREPDVWMKSSNLMTVLTTLQQSDSLCILPDLAVRSMVAPRLCALPVDLRRKKFPLSLIFREELSEWGMLIDLLALSRACFDAAES